MNPDIRKINDLLIARPFVPFTIKCGQKEFKIKRRRHARFNHNGTLEVRTETETYYLNNDRVSLL